MYTDIIEIPTFVLHALQNCCACVQKLGVTTNNDYLFETSCHLEVPSTRAHTSAHITCSNSSGVLEKLTLRSRRLRMWRHLIQTISTNRLGVWSNAIEHEIYCRRRCEVYMKQKVSYPSFTPHAAYLGSHFADGRRGSLSLAAADDSRRTLQPEWLTLGSTVGFRLNVVVANDLLTDTVTRPWLWLQRLC